MARPLRIEYPGAVYHIMTRGNNRQKIFKDDGDRKSYLERLVYYCRLKEVDLLCYCLQSNHIHLLLGTPKGNLSKFMQPFQTSYTVYFNRRHGRTGHVFEQRYKALVVDKDNYLLQVSRYIHLNPVEARVVQRPQDYPWSSYRGHLGEKCIDGLMTSTVLEQMGGSPRAQIERYRAFVEEGGPRDGVRLWLPTIKQSIVGGADFAERVLKETKKQEEAKRNYTLNDVEKAVCRVNKIGAEDLQRPLRSAVVKRAREVYMYVARRQTQASLREIADRLGVRDISTVSHGERRVASQLKQNDVGMRELKRCLQKVYSLIQA
jgi:putative transposase